MIRLLSGLLSAIFLCVPNLMPCKANAKAYHWFCAHVKDHAAPTLDKTLEFVEDLDGYYLDRKHADPADEDKVIYLTFDAGYENGNVEKILDVLKEEDVRGAFFILGHLITNNTDLVKRMANEGHTVCNHTVHHNDMSTAEESAFIAELKELEDLYREKIGLEMAPYYRPPQGIFSQGNLENAMKNGYKTIFWSFAYPDWDNARQMDPDKAKRIVLDNLHNGEVMLLHPTSATNAAILADVIREAKSMGYRFGTLDELTVGGT